MSILYRTIEFPFTFPVLLRKGRWASTAVSNLLAIPFLKGFSLCSKGKSKLAPLSVDTEVLACLVHYNDEVKLRWYFKNTYKWQSKERTCEGWLKRSKPLYDSFKGITPLLPFAFTQAESLALNTDFLGSGIVGGIGGLLMTSVQAFKSLPSAKSFVMSISELVFESSIQRELLIFWLGKLYISVWSCIALVLPIQMLLYMGC